MAHLEIFAAQQKRRPFRCSFFEIAEAFVSTFPVGKPHSKLCVPVYLRGAWI